MSIELTISKGFSEYRLPGVAPGYIYWTSWFFHLSSNWKIKGFCFGIQYTFHVYLFLNNFYKMPCKQYVFLVYQCHHFDEHKYTETAFKYDNKEALLIHVLKQGYF